MGVEEERKPGRETVDRKSGVDGGFDVGDRVGEREGDFLFRGGTGLADVVTADGDGVPFRKLFGRPCEEVGDDPHGGTRRIDVGSAGDVLFQDVVLDRAVQIPDVRTLLARDEHIKRKQHGGGGVDGHGGGNLLQTNPLEEPAHVGQGGDGDADATHLTGGHGVVGIEADLGGEVEGDGEAGGALFEEVAVAGITFGG